MGDIFHGYLPKLNFYHISKGRKFSSSLKTKRSVIHDRCVIYNNQFDAEETEYFQSYMLVVVNSDSNVPKSIYLFFVLCKSITNSNEIIKKCWNSNSNTLDFLWTPSTQQARRLFLNYISLSPSL